MWIGLGSAPRTEFSYTGRRVWSFERVGPQALSANGLPGCPQPEISPVDNRGSFHSQPTESGLDRTHGAVSRVVRAIVAWAVGTVVAGKSTLG